jgi:hypothetical protein
VPVSEIERALIAWHCGRLCVSGALPYIRARAPLRKPQYLLGHGWDFPPRGSSLSQISYRSSPSIPLVEAHTVMCHGAIGIDQKNIGLGGSTARHEYFWGFVSCDFEHSLTHR